MTSISLSSSVSSLLLFSSGFKIVLKKLWVTIGQPEKTLFKCHFACVYACKTTWVNACLIFWDRVGIIFLEAGLRKLVKGTFFIYLMEETVQTFLVMGWCSTFFVIKWTYSFFIINFAPVRNSHRTLGAQDIKSVLPHLSIKTPWMSTCGARECLNVVTGLKSQH